MTPTPPKTEQTITDAIARTRSLAKAAARRCFARDLVQLAGPALTIALAGSLVGVVADRLIGPGLPWWWIVAPATGLALAASVGLALYRRGNDLEAVSEVDRAMALEDRLSSALDLAEKNPNDPFVQMAIADAEHLSSRVRARQAIEVRLGRSWLAWPVAAAAAICVGVFVQPMHLLRSDDQVAAETEQQSRIEQAVNRLNDLKQSLDAASQTDDPTVDDPDASANLLAPEQREYIEQLQNQVEAGEITPEQAEAEIARMLDEAASEREQRARDERANDEALRNLLKNLSSESSSGDLAGKDRAAETAEELRDALRSGDLDRAADALDELRDLAEQSDPEDRERVARELDDLADELDRLAQQEAQRRDREKRQQREDLTRRGLSGEQAERFTEEQRPQTREEIARELEEQGFDPDRADDLARRIEEQQRQNRASENAENTSEELRDAMRDSAEETRSMPEHSQDQQSDPSDPGQTGESQAGQSEPGEPGEPDPGQEQQDRQESGDQPGGDEAAGDRPGSEPSGEDQPTREPGEGGEPRQTEGDQPSESPGGEQPSGERQEGAGPDSEAAPAQGTGDSEEGQRPGEEGSEQRPGTREDGSEGSQQPPDSSGRPETEQQEGTSGSSDESQADPNAPEGAGDSSDRSGEAPGDQGSAGDGQTPGDSETGSPSSSPDGQPGDQQPGGESGQAPPGSDAGEGTGGEGDATPGGGATEDVSGSAAGGDQAGSGEAQRRSPSDILRERQNQSRRADTDQAAAETLREQQRRLLEDESTAGELDRMRRQESRDRREGVDRPVEEIDARRRAEQPGQETVVGEQESDGSRPLTADRPRQSAGQLERDLVQRREQLQRDLEENRISPRYWETVSRYFDKSIERQRRLQEQGEPGTSGSESNPPESNPPPSGSSSD